jgi:hypothetical protein
MKTQILSMKRRNKKMQDYYEKFKKNCQAKIREMVLDPQGLLTGNGYGLEGIYMLSYENQKLNLSVPAYIGQAGVIVNAPTYVASDVYERILQHLKRFLGGNYLKYWSGLDPEDKDWKIKVELLIEERDHSKRLKEESRLIEKIKPLLQDSKNGTYELYPTRYGYKRNDLCLHPWKREGENEGQRSVAFRAKVEELLQQTI